MADILCGYTADRDETLTAYLYGEIEPAQRVTFEGHIATCERCRKELADLQGVRLRLEEWAAPEMARPFVRIPAGAAIHADLPTSVSTDGNDVPRARRMRALPVWAQTAAALLLLGVSAGIANLDVHYDQSGLSIRTGWSRTTARPVGEGPASAPAAAPATVLKKCLRFGMCPSRWRDAQQAHRLPPRITSVELPVPSRWRIVADVT
jgi:anti-sigma factor RsiW